MNSRNGRLMAQYWCPSCGELNDWTTTLCQNVVQQHKAGSGEPASATTATTTTATTTQRCNTKRPSSILIEKKRFINYITNRNDKDFVHLNLNSLERLFVESNNDDHYDNNLSTYETCRGRTSSTRMSYFDISSRRNTNVVDGGNNTTAAENMKGIESDTFDYSSHSLIKHQIDDYTTQDKTKNSTNKTCNQKDIVDLTFDDERENDPITIDHDEPITIDHDEPITHDHDIDTNYVQNELAQAEKLKPHHQEQESEELNSVSASVPSTLSSSSCVPVNHNDTTNHKINTKSRATRVESELNKLRDHTKSGVDFTSSNNITTATLWECPHCTHINTIHPTVCTACSNDKESIRKPRNVFEVHDFMWNHSSRPQQIEETTNLPIKFQMPNIRLITALKQGVMYDFRTMSNQSCTKIALSNPITPVTSSYYKAHFDQNFVDRNYDVLNQLLPPGFKIRQGSKTSIIAFLNKDDGTCDTHYDRDSSLLYLAKGSKQVLLAPQSLIKKDGFTVQTNSTIFDNVKPFHNKTTLNQALKKGWKSVYMKPGDWLFIPKNCVHSIKSKRKTLAFSFQVTKDHKPKLEDVEEQSRALIQHVEEICTTTNRHISNVVNCSTSNNKRLLPDYEAILNENKKSKTDDVSKIQMFPRDNEATINNNNQVKTELVIQIVERSGKQQKQPKQDMKEEAKREEKYSISRSVIYPTRQTPKRKKRVCGMEGCNNGFIVNTVDMLMWYLIPKDKTSTHVPTYFPKHLICTKCGPSDASEEIFDPKDEWKKDNEGVPVPYLTLEEFPDRDKYYYARGSKIDYENFAENNCKGNLHSTYDLIPTKVEVVKDEV